MYEAWIQSMACVFGPPTQFEPVTGRSEEQRCTIVGKSLLVGDHHELRGHRGSGICADQGRDVRGDVLRVYRGDDVAPAARDRPDGASHGFNRFGSVRFSRTWPSQCVGDQGAKLDDPQCPGRDGLSAGR